MNLFIRPDGTAQCLYSEDINLSVIGVLNIRRASHVEPGKHGEWIADLRPSGGPVMTGFKTRSEALAAEADWLNREMTQRNVTPQETTVLDLD
jgi:hypothetical protein